MDLAIRENMKGVLRKYLLGKENMPKRDEITKKLKISDSTIRAWTASNSNTIPVADDLPEICEILGISIYELYGISDPFNLSDEDKFILKKIKGNISLKNVVLNVKD